MKLATTTRLDLHLSDYDDDDDGIVDVQSSSSYSKDSMAGYSREAKSWQTTIHWITAAAVVAQLDVTSMLAATAVVAAAVAIQRPLSTTPLLLHSISY